jgi:hypothetical protein
MGAKQQRPLMASLGFYFSNRLASSLTFSMMRTSESGR